MSLKLSIVDTSAVGILLLRTLCSSVEITDI
jgi:hypothetical protein